MTLGPASQSSDTSSVRYGVFLRPSPELIDASLRAFAIGEHQFGLTAASAYPPHITLVGSIALTVPEENFIESLDAVLENQPARRIVTTGMTLSDDGFVGLRFRDHESSPAPLAGLMGEVLEAARPLRHFPLGDRTREHRMKDSPETFAPHLTLVGHDGRDSLDLTEECFEVLTALGIGDQPEWVGDVVTLYRFTSDDWSGRYWETLAWRPLKSWRLA